MHFIAKDIFRKKMGFFLLLCLGYVLAIWNFGSYSTKYQHYQLYYTQSYFAAAGFVFDKAIYQSANVFSLIFQNRTDESSRSNDLAESIPVLLYHGILKETDGTNVSLTTFEDQMFALKKAGYQTISVDDLHLFLQGKKQLPAKSFLLTFDDGRKDSYYPADPILHALGYNAVMFTIADFSLLSDSNYYLTKDEIKNVVKNPRWVIESHTRTHRNLGEVPASELSSEIVDSKKILEDLTGKPINSFAFPFGELGQETVPQVGGGEESKKQIMQLAVGVYQMSFFQFFTPKRFTQNYVDLNKEDGNYLVKRMEPQPSWSGDDLLARLETGYAKNLPFHASLDKYDGWINTLWGNMVLGSSTLTVVALPTTTGSATVLDGSRLWSNYEFNAHVNSSLGSNDYLWARYQDDENYVACNFGNNLVHVEQTMNGKTEVIKGSDVYDLDYLKSKGFDAAIRVNGRDVACLVDGRVVVETSFLDEKLGTGGVGLKVWDPSIGMGKIEATDIRVEPI